MGIFRKRQDRAEETRAMHAIDRGISEAVRNDPDARAIFRTATEPTPTTWPGLDDSLIRRRDAELQQYTKVKAAKGESSRGIFRHL